MLVALATQKLSAQCAMHAFEGADAPSSHKVSRAQHIIKYFVLVEPYMERFDLDAW